MIAGAAGGDKEAALMDDDDENVTDQYLRDPFDVISYYQTNMLCHSFA